LVQRRCDAIYVGFTSTSGRIMVGHELKVSRSDWQHELDTPGKADPWHDACHEWWVVAPSTAIVDPATLPAGWGLMVPSTRSATRMDKIVKPALRADLTPPWWAVRSVMARQDTLRADAIRVAKAKAETEIRAEVERRVTERVKNGIMTSQQRWDVETAAAFRAAGIELTRGHGFADDHLGLNDLLPLVGLIRQNRDIEEIRHQLAERWGGAHQVLDAAQQLVKAVDALIPGGA
jgi:hypothetical protein